MYDHKNTGEIVKALGKHTLILASPDGEKVETTLTLQEFIHYVLTAGACVSSPYNTKDREEMS